MRLCKKLLQLVAALILSSGTVKCRSASESQTLVTPPKVVVPPPHNSNKKTQASPEPSLTLFSVLAQIAELENAFSRGNCDKVVELRTSFGLAPTESVLLSLPPITALAILLCDKPLKKSKEEHAEYVLKISDKIVNKTENIVNNIIIDKYKLAFITDDLSGADASIYHDLLDTSPVNDKLIAILKNLEVLEPKITSKAGINILLQYKASIIGKLEALFVIELFELETKKIALSPDTFKDAVNEAKAKFAHKTFEKRIDNLVSGNNSPINANGTSDTNNLASPTPLPPVVDVTEKILQDARAALNAGDPEKAVLMLSAIAEKDQNEHTKRLRKDAAEQHVKNIRLNVRELYSKASAQKDKKLKIESLKQCKELLEIILSRYPENTSRPGVERNLKSIVNEIEFLTKG